MINTCYYCCHLIWYLGAFNNINMYIIYTYMYIRMYKIIEEILQIMYIIPIRTAGSGRCLVLYSMIPAGCR